MPATLSTTGTNKTGNKATKKAAHYSYAALAAGNTHKVSVIAVVALVVVAGFDATIVAYRLVNLLHSQLDSTLLDST